VTLAFPPVVAPLASIVMPTHNAWDWTRRALSAISEHTHAPYEVIVCDNASSDETPKRLTEIENARVVLNAENLGFGVACNQGAALAHSRHVVFLNSDAVVHENWLGPLLQHLTSDTRVGAVGPLLLDTDGSIQAAGSTVVGEGWPVDHRGLRDDFTFPMVVDYVAGACLVTRRSSFHDVGGFDSSYGLAYYEDVDLCYRLRAAGYQIVFEPGSAVTHALGISSDQEHKDQFVGRNRPLFGARWRDNFAGRPSLDESRNLPPLFLRDMSADARLLILAGRQPELCRDVVTRLVSRGPNFRVAVVGAPPTDLPSAVERIATADWASVLRDRRFHYDAVLMLELDHREEVAAALDESQPQAVRLEVGNDDDHVLCALLAEAGIVWP